MPSGIASCNTLCSWIIFSHKTGGKKKKKHLQNLEPRAAVNSFLKKVPKNSGLTLNLKCKAHTAVPHANVNNSQNPSQMALKWPLHIGVHSKANITSTQECSDPRSGCFFNLLFFFLYVCYGDWCGSIAANKKGLKLQNYKDCDHSGWHKQIKCFYCIFQNRAWHNETKK